MASEAEGGVGAPSGQRTITFNGIDFENVTPDQILEMLQKTFVDADKDGSGELDHAEISEVVKAYYKKEGVSRSLSKVEAEVAAAMVAFDANRSGALDFTEFLQMYASGEHFRFQIPLDVRSGVIDLELRQRLKNMDPALRLRGTMLKACGGILIHYKVLASSRVISMWKCNRMRDGFRFFRNKAAALQARVGRIQAGLEPLVGSTPPETPRWMNVASPPSMVRRRPSIHNGNNGKASENDHGHGGIPRSPSLDSDMSGVVGNGSDGLPSPMLRTALQNEAAAQASRTAGSSVSTTPSQTPDITPRDM